MAEAISIEGASYSLVVNSDLLFSPFLENLPLSLPLPFGLLPIDLGPGIFKGLPKNFITLFPFPPPFPLPFNLFFPPIPPSPAILARALRPPLEDNETVPEVADEVLIVLHSLADRIGCEQPLSERFTGLRGILYVFREPEFETDWLGECVEGEAVGGEDEDEDWACEAVQSK